MGTFNWDSVTADWNTSSLGTSAQTTYTASSDAYFTAPSTASNVVGVIVVGSQVANSLQFDYSATTIYGQSGTSTLTVGTGGINSNGNQSVQATTLDASLGTVLLSTSQEWNWSSGQSRLFTVNAGVAGTALPGNSMELFPYTAGGLSNYNNGISDGTGGGKLILSRITNGAGTVSLNGTNSYTGGTIIDGGAITVGAAGILGPGSVYIGAGALRLTAATNFAASNYANNGTTGFLISPYGGVEIANSALLPTGTTGANLPISAQSAGFISLFGTYSPAAALNLGSALGDGTMFLGAIASGTYNHAGFAGLAADNNYRLGAGGGTLTFNQANTLVAGSGNGLIVGENTPGILGLGSFDTGVVKFIATQSYTGGTTVNLGSVVEGDVASTASATPFGSTTSAITLNGGTIQVDVLAAATSNTTTVGALTFNGPATARVNNVVSATPSAVTQLNISSLTRQSQGILQIAGIGSYTTLGGDSQVVIANPGTLTTNGSNYNGATLYMAPAFLVDSTGNFLTYNASTGFADATTTYATIGAAVTSGNSDDYVKTTAADASFTGTGTQSLYALNAGSTVTGAGGTLAISSGGLTISGGNIGSATAGSNVNLAFGTAEALIYSQSSPTLYGQISGSGGLTKSGPGTLTLNPMTNGAVATSNSFSGNITVNAGVLAAQSDIALGASSNNIILNGGTFIFGGANSSAFTTGRTFTIGGDGGYFSANSGVTSTFNGPITTTTTAPFIDFVNGNASRFVFTSNSDTFTAPIIVENRVTLAFSNDLQLGNSANSIVLNAVDNTSNAVGSPALQATATVSTNRNFFLTGPSTVGDTLDADFTGGTFTVNGVISGDSSLNARSTALGGTLQLTASNTYYGGTSVGTGATLQAENPHALGVAGPTPVSLSGDSTLDLATDTSVAAYNTVFSPSGSGTLLNGTIVSDRFTAASPGIPQTLGDLTITGAGTLSAIGGVNVSGGSPVIAFSGPTYLTSTAGVTSFLKPMSAAITLTSVTSYAPATKTDTLDLDGTNSANLISGAITDDHGIAGTTAIIKSNTSTWVLTGSNTYSGATNITGGTLQIGAGNTSGQLGTANVANAGALVFDLSSNPTVANTISGAGSLTQEGTGTLTVTASNTYTGSTTLAAGELDVDVADVPGTAGPLGKSGTINLNGGYLQYSTLNQTDYSSRFSTAANQQYNIDTNSQSVNFASALNSSGGSLTKIGSGTLTVPTSSTYGGTTAVNGGTLDVTGALTNSGTINVTATSIPAALILDGASAVSSTAPITLTGASSNLIVNNTQTLASIASAGNSTFAAGTSLVGTGNGIGTGTTGNTGSTSGGISGTGTLTVNGGANLYAANIIQSVLNIGGTNTVTIEDSSAPGNSAATSVLTDISNAGTLDLKNNDLIVLDTTQYTTIKNLINNAADGGAWDQAGITSSSAKANNSVYGLGYAQASTIGTTSFDGQTFTDAVLVKYTLLGDTQLRGAVGIGDYDTVLNNFGTGTDWSQGNFHYSGTVGIGDYDAVLNNFGGTATGNLAAGPALARGLTPALSINPNFAKADLKLEVNTVTGDVYVLANASVGFAGYTVADPSAHLLGGSTSPDPAKLLSVAAQSGGNTNVFETAGTYVNWNKITEVANQIAEGQNNNGYANHSSRDDTVNIPAGGTIDFGDIYNTAAGVQDITFNFAEAGSNPTNGPAYYGAEVDYVTTPEPATLGLLGLGGTLMMRRRRKVAPGRAKGMA